MKVHLVRHGQTDWNLERKAQGHTDIPLNANGLKQAEATAKHFSGSAIQHIWTSDLRRASQTAERIATELGVSYTTTRELREQSFGVLEGSNYAQLGTTVSMIAQLQGIPRHQARPENGESSEDVWHRISPVVRQLEQLTEDLIIVCHGGTMGILLSQLMGGDFGISRSFVFSNACITTLGRPGLDLDGRFRLIDYNFTGHLQPLVATAHSH